MLIVVVLLLALLDRLSALRCSTSSPPPKQLLYSRTTINEDINYSLVNESLNLDTTFTLSGHFLWTPNSTSTRPHELFLSLHTPDDSLLYQIRLTKFNSTTYELSAAYTHLGTVQLSTPISLPLNSPSFFLLGKYGLIRC